MYATESSTGTSADRESSDLRSSSLVTPSILTIDRRLEFRRLVLEALEMAASSGKKVMQINLYAVVEIDASGLGILILAQKRARERGMRLRLVEVPRAVASLLDATRLGSLFELVHAH